MKSLAMVLFMPLLTFTVQAAADSARDTYEQYCSACHDQGAFGAPIVGDSEAWSGRIAKGSVILNYSAINGFVGLVGVMPAKGGHLNLEDSKVEDAVQYMIDKSW